MPAIGNMHRVILDLAEGKLVRMRFKALNGEGKYVDVAHPWGRKELTDLRKARQSVTLAAGGHSDFDDVMDIVNQPKGSRVRGRKGRHPSVEPEQR